MPRVKIFRRVLHTNNINVVRQKIVKSVLNFARCDVGFQFGNFQMRDLPDGVNACVGSSRTADFDFRFKKLPRRQQQFALHRFRIMLNLPAAIARSFVFDF